MLSCAVLLPWDAVRTKCPEGRVMCWCCINCLSLDPHLGWLRELVLTDAVQIQRGSSCSRVMFLHNPRASVTSVPWDSLFLILFTQHISICLSLLLFLKISLCSPFANRSSAFAFFVCPPHTSFVPGDWIAPYCKIGLISVNRCLLNIGLVLLDC